MSRDLRVRNLKASNDVNATNIFSISDITQNIYSNNFTQNGFLNNSTITTIINTNEFSRKIKTNNIESYDIYDNRNNDMKLNKPLFYNRRGLGIVDSSQGFIKYSLNNNVNILNTTTGYDIYKIDSTIDILKLTSNQYDSYTLNINLQDALNDLEDYKNYFINNRPNSNFHEQLKFTKTIMIQSAIDNLQGNLFTGNFSINLNKGNNLSNVKLYRTTTGITMSDNTNYKIIEIQYGVSSVRRRINFSIDFFIDDSSIGNTTSFDIYIAMTGLPSTN
jgi:hypothetical protein